MYFHYAKNLKVKDVQVRWEKPESARWQSALYFEEINGLKIEGFAGAPAKAKFPSLVLDQVEGASIVDSQARLGRNCSCALWARRAATSICSAMSCTARALPSKLTTACRARGEVGEQLLIRRQWRVASDQWLAFEATLS